MDKEFSPLPNYASPKPHKRASTRAVLVIAVVAMLAVLLSLASWQARRAAEDRDTAQLWRAHTRDVLEVTGQVKVEALTAIRGERGFLLTQDPVFLGPYLHGKVELPRRIARLEHLTRDNPVQNARVVKVGTQATTYLATLGHMVELAEQGDGDRAITIVKSGVGRHMIEQMMANLDQIERTEHAFLAQRQATSVAAFGRSDRFQTMLTGVGLLLLVMVLVAINYLRRAVVREDMANRELRRLASSDDLTGLANRREFMGGLERAIAGARRSGRPLALALVDIDHFKRVNDAHGHPAGDEVIRSVADAAADAMRGGDLVGRIGGEEFAILLPDTDLDAAWDAGERLRQTIQAHNIRLPSGDIVKVTLSCGVAVARRDDDSDSLIARADAALYEAKNGGRSKVLLAA